ncbi:unnamed protein product [Didymodactylos carnosus]|uniref:Uncharacterized protein n=1 Tax=Didymodactylos carnosus TaxID=1234261 RepID=A0A8S3AGU0_9BILA|nr:unnamed protein product [Didymodactylos carnosus]
MEPQPNQEPQPNAEATTASHPL